MKKFIFLSLFLALFLTTGCVKKTVEQTSPPQTNNQQDTVIPEEVATTTKAIYFGKESANNYFLVNVANGESKTFIPSGYTIVSNWGYQMFPTFLILQKDNGLYSYDVENKTVVDIFSSSENLKLNKDEEAIIHPSITEKNQFIIKIDTFDKSEVSEFDGSSPILSSRTYSFDASINKLVSIKNPELYGCTRYDSKNQRFFVWPCGEGVGSSAPLSINDLTGKESKKVITQEDFNFNKDYNPPAFIQYSNGLFFASDTYPSLSKIIVVDSKLVNPEKETYTIRQESQDQIAKLPSQINQSPPNSVSIDKSQNTIIIGYSYFILLLRFDTNNQIVESKDITEPYFYGNSIFVNNGKLYYQTEDAIRVVNLNTWQIEQSIPSSRDSRDITLFTFDNEN